MAPLTAKRINVLRMILLWSSSGNVLRMQGALKKKIKDVSVPVHSTEVTRLQLDNVFGSTVPYEYVLKGKRIYDARITYWDGANYFHCLLQLINHMASAASKLSIECFWVIVKSNLEHATMVVLAVPDNDSTEGILSLLCLHVFLHGDRLQSVDQSLVEAFRAHSQHLQGFRLFVIPDASKSEIKRLNDFRDHVDVTLSMLIPVVGNAKLTASNCSISDPVLHKLFFNGSPTVDPEGATDGTGADATADVDRKIACQVSNHRSALTFPAEEHHSDDEEKEEDESTTAATKPLIDDYVRKSYDNRELQKQATSSQTLTIRT